VKLSVVDTPGFGDYVNNRDSWTPVIDFIDDQHESFMRQEQQPTRHGKVDMRVHACLYFIRPTGHRYKYIPCNHHLTQKKSLKPLDIEIMKRLGSRVNLIPIIAKADTLTPKNLRQFKENVIYIYTYNAKLICFDRFVNLLKAIISKYMHARWKVMMRKSQHVITALQAHRRMQ
jgi:septin family protein